MNKYMNVIKCISWSAVEPLYKEWDTFKNVPEPQKLNTAKFFVDTECIRGKTPKRTLGYVRETVGDPTTTDNILGCVIVYAKDVKGISIGGIGKMAVNPLYRKNGVATQLLDVALAYMFQAGFDISILWASVLKVYEKAGYVPLTDNHKETNLMYRPIKGLPTGWTKQMLLDLHKQIGTF